MPQVIEGSQLDAVRKLGMQVCELRGISVLASPPTVLSAAKIRVLNISDESILWSLFVDLARQLKYLKVKWILMWFPESLVPERKLPVALERLDIMEKGGKYVHSIDLPKELFHETPGIPTIDPIPRPVPQNNLPGASSHVSRPPRVRRTASPGDTQ